MKASSTEQFELAFKSLQSLLQLEELYNSSIDINYPMRDQFMKEGEFNAIPLASSHESDIPPADSMKLSLTPPMFHHFLFRWIKFLHPIGFQKNTACEA